MGVAQYWHLGGFARPSLQAALRAFQFIFAIVVAALYGVDLHNATKSHTKAPTPLVFAEVVACLSLMTCVVHCFGMVTHAAWCVWDFVPFILRVALFGVFGSVYIGGKNTNFENAMSSVSRMKAAVWMDLVNMLLWLASIAQGIAWCCVRRRKARRTDKEVVDRKSLESEYHALEFVETQSSGEVEAGDLKQIQKEEIFNEKRQAAILSKGSTLTHSDFISKEV